MNVEVHTDRAAFREAAADAPGGARVPVEVRVPVADPYDAYRRARRGPGGAYLETTGGQSGWGYFGVDPVERLTVRPDAAVHDPETRGDYRRPSPTLAALGGLLDGERLARGDCAVPYPCGAVGWLSYDVARELESLPGDGPDAADGAVDDRGLPRLQVGVFDRLAAWEEPREGGTTLRVTTCPAIPAEAGGGALDDAYDDALDRGRALATRAVEGEPSVGPSPVEADEARFESDAGRAAFAERVRRVKAYVRDGDTFQANVSQRLVAPAAVHPVEAFDALRSVNPAPYSGLLEFARPHPSSEASNADGSTRNGADGSTGTDPDGSTGNGAEGRTENDPDGSTGTDPDGSTGTDADGSTGNDPDGSTGTDPDGSTRNGADRRTENDPDGRAEFGVDLVSASPELLLRRDGDRLLTEPIAGTRPRGEDREADAALERDLLTDGKERAEHAMLVDLERNDLGKVCEYGSVGVPEYRRVDRYSEVMHLVSLVEGTARPDVGFADAVGAVFPGGTITGAPKPRTMEIIDEVEPTRRGPYTGSVFLAGFDGRATLNIVIRTLTRWRDEYHLRVGAGIVHDSEPDAEYEETLDKGRALVTAIDDALAAGRLRVEEVADD